MRTARLLPRLLRLASLVSALLLLGGCAARLKSAASDAAVKMPERLVPAVADASLSSLEDAETRRRIASIVGTPELQQTVQEVARSATEGVLTDPSLDLETLRRAIDEEVAHATQTVLQTMAADMPQTLTPAARSTLVGLLDAPDVRAVVSATAADATRAALHSSVEALQELHRTSPEQSPIAKLQRMLTAAVIAAFALGVAAAALVGWSLGLRRDAKKMHELAKASITTKNGPVS